jgi:hypothetical protein
VPKFPIGAISNFYKIRGYICNFVFITGVVYTGDKLSPVLLFLAINYCRGVTRTTLVITPFSRIFIEFMTPAIILSPVTIALAIKRLYQ